VQNSPPERCRPLLLAAFALAAVLASAPARAQSSGADGGAPSPRPAEVPPLPTAIAPAPLKDPLQPPLLTQETLGLSVGGVGAIGFLVGAGLGITATIKKGESSAGGHCIGNLCDHTGAALLNTSIDYGNWSTVMFVAGSVLFAGGIVLMATAPVQGTAPNATPPLAPAPRPIPASARLVLGPGSLVLTGQW
jgi:uncharacterized membrane protein YgdD (TMEM256/DUF423 family)